MRRRVIIVTDGDIIAQKAVEEAARNVGGRCISRSAGNPTFLSGSTIRQMIKIARYDPVVVMADDRGHIGMGLGEKVIFSILEDEEIEVIGVVAVASNTQNAKGIKVNCSVDKYGNIVKSAVNKYGNALSTRIIIGDTVNMLCYANIKYIVGIGDPGKMDGKDNARLGAPIVTKALEEILRNYNNELTSSLKK